MQYHEGITPGEGAPERMSNWAEDSGLGESSVPKNDNNESGEQKSSILRNPYFQRIVAIALTLFATGAVIKGASEYGGQVLAAGQEAVDAEMSARLKSEIIEKAVAEGIPSEELEEILNSNEYKEAITSLRNQEFPTLEEWMENKYGREVVTDGETEKSELRLND